MKKIGLLLCLLSVAFLISCRNYSNEAIEELPPIESGGDTADSYVEIKEDSDIPQEEKSSIPLEYFENVDRNYKIEDIEKEIGNYNRFTGSGVINYVWVLEDESEAWVYFSESDGKICRIEIINEETDYLLYNRWDENATQ